MKVYSVDGVQESYTYGPVDYLYIMYRVSGKGLCVKINVTNPPPPPPHTHTLPPTHVHFHSGHPGLWLDESFYHGASYKCSTFNNDCLASGEEFICSGVEAWGFL